MAKKMISRVSWERFRKDGMLWFVNRLLHFFGYAIVFDFYDKGSKKGKLKEVYVARCKFRGFGTTSETNGYERVTKYMKRNADRLVNDLGE